MLPGPDAPYSELSGALAWLLVGSVLAQLLSYASVFGVNLLAHTKHEKDLASHFITGLFVARVPLLLFQAVQAALLPKLAGLASEGKHDDFRIGMRRLIMVVIVLCVGGNHRGHAHRPVGGPEAVRRQVGPRQPRHVPADARGDRLHPGAHAGAGTDRARRRTARTRLPGSSASSCSSPPSRLGNDLILRNELGFLAGSTAAAALMAALLFPRMRRGGATLQDLVEVVEHEPLEI